MGRCSGLELPSRRQSLATTVSTQTATDAALGLKDRVAYRALLAFTWVLFIRPQDQLRFLEPLHLAEVFGTFGIWRLIGGRLTRGVPVAKLTLELGAVLALGSLMLATAPFSIWPGGAVSVVTDLFSKVVVVYFLITEYADHAGALRRFVNVVVLSCCYVAVRAVIDYGLGHPPGRARPRRGRGRPVRQSQRHGIEPRRVPAARDHRDARPRASIVARGSGHRRAGHRCRDHFQQEPRRNTRLDRDAAVLLYPDPAGSAQRGRGRDRALPGDDSPACRHRSPSGCRASSTQRRIITGSREARKRLLREAYQAYLDHPVFGLGAGQFHNYNPSDREETWHEAHNAWLQVASELGTGGVLIFAVIVGSGFVAGVQAGSGAAASTGALQARDRKCLG